MAQGLQVFDAAGSLVFDLTDRLQRVLGAVYTGGAAGSINVPDFAYGTPFFFIQREGDLSQFYVACKSVSISGNTLQWSSEGVAVTVIYGIY